MARPVQIILNPENFDERREAGGGGPNRDFFANRDKEFIQHKRRLIYRLQEIANYLDSARMTDIGYVKVILRRKALAKSHRPVKALFKRSLTPTVGGRGLGEMIIEAMPSALLQVASEIDRAEESTRWKFNEALGREIPNPTRAKSEAGAIERIELFSASDRRNFSLKDALLWLSNPATGGDYEVELFNSPPPRSAMDALDNSRRRMFQSFGQGLRALGHGLTVERIRVPVRSHARVAVRIHQADSTPIVRLRSFRTRTSDRTIAPFDSSEKRHRLLLSFLDDHPLVRRISLPGIVVRSDNIPARALPAMIRIPKRNPNATYPKIGIIDGGLDSVLSGWLIGTRGFLASVDRSLEHGTFIGGLAVAGMSLNGRQCCPEPDGAELVDIDVLPKDNAETFASYFPGGPHEFFDEIETAISESVDRHGIKVFNMSINFERPASLDVYDSYAARLDSIAEENSAIIFLSAGNIGPDSWRPEWPLDDTQALANLATATNHRIYTPAESVRNVSVAALNPPGLPTSVLFAPARYSRRGPGLRAGVKPDLAHIGGSGSPASEGNHGLFSVSPGGKAVSCCGTSYAAPLVAKTAAALENEIEGGVSRETMIALLIHNARIPDPLRSKPMISVARYLIGFGIPGSAHSILETDDHSMTMVFSSRIRPSQQVVFRFRWPQSLVKSGGSCRGRARLTLVSTPPIDLRFGSELVRVNVNAALQQQKPDGGWTGQLDPIYLPGKGDAPTFEAELIQHGLKWRPVKVFEKYIPKGVGKSSIWRLYIEHLTRSNEEMPEQGVPFTAILTISDPDGTQPVFDNLRQSLLDIGVRMADIRTAARIMPRI